MKISLICVFFGLTIFCSQILPQEVELLYSKPQPNYYYTSPTSEHIAIFGYNRIILIDANNGNIVFAKQLTQPGAAQGIVFFLTIIDTTNKIIIGHKIGQNGKGLNLEEFNFSTGKVLRSETFLKDKEIIGSDLSPDCKYFATVDKDFDAKVFDYQTGTVIWEIKSTIDTNFLVYDLKFSKDSKYIALLGGTKILVCDINEKRVVYEINSVSFPSHRIAFSPNNKYIFKFYFEKSVDVFDIAKGIKVFSLIHPDKVYDVFVEGDDEILYAKTYESAYVWNLKDGSLIDSLTKIGNFPLRKLRKEKEDYFVIGSGEKITLINRSTKETKILIYKILFPQFIDGGAHFISEYLNSKIFSSLTLDLLFSLSNKKLFNVSALNSQGYYFDNDTLFWIDIYSGNILKKEYLPLEKYLSNFKFSDDFSYYTYYDSSKNLRIYDWATKRLQLVIDNPSYFSYKRFSPTLCLFSKNNTFVAFITSDTLDLMKYKIKVFSLKHSQFVFETIGTYNTTPGFTFSYDEKYFFYRIGESPIYQVDLGNGQLVGSYEVPYLEGSTLPFHFLSFPNTTWLILSSNKSAKIIILDYKNNNIISVMDDTEIGLTPYGSNSLISLDISNDGQFLIAQYEDAVTMRRIMKFASTEDNLPRSENKPNFSFRLNNQTLEIKAKTSEFKCHSVQIFDYLGRIVCYKNFDDISSDALSFQIDIGHLLSGIYFVALNTGKSIETFSFVVIK